MLNKKVVNFEQLPDILTINDVATILRIGRTKAYELSKLTGFPVIKIGKSIRVSKQKLEEWLKNMR